MSERRKLNNVYGIPCTLGIITIMGTIGNGNTKEEVILKKHAPIHGTDMVIWNSHRGEQWKELEKLVELE